MQFVKKQFHNFSSNDLEKFQLEFFRKHHDKMAGRLDKLYYFRGIELGFDNCYPDDFRCFWKRGYDGWTLQEEKLVGVIKVIRIAIKFLFRLFVGGNRVLFRVGVSE